MELMSLLPAADTRPPLVKHRHRDHAAPLMVGAHPHAGFQLVGTGVIDRWIEGAEESPAHDFQATLRERHDARIRFAHQRRGQLPHGIRNPSSNAFDGFDL